MKYNLSGNIIDVENKKIFSGTIYVENGKISKIKKDNKKYDQFIIPGFIDAHIHIESSMITPSEFARAATPHGTIAVVTDPHEIANVLGIEGVKYMIEDGKKSPMKFYFSAPSCVPATKFETNGATLGLEETEELLKMEEIKYLGEFMDFPAVINDDPIALGKIQLAKKYSKNIDGHAPFVSQSDLRKYVEAGISTDHECITERDALEKIELGLKVLIREGSACTDFSKLIPILEDNYQSCMFCCDDKHPDDLIENHINELVKRALDYGVDLMKVLQTACVNPVKHYGLEVGLLQEGDDADFLVIDDPKKMNILKTYIKGEIVSEKGETTIPRSTSTLINKFKTKIKNMSDFKITPKGRTINVIGVDQGIVATNRLIETAKIEDNKVVSDIENDVLKIAVVNRYEDVKPALGFVKGFGLEKGAIASSIAHDSHNIVVVGVDDESIVNAVNAIIKKKGGICVANKDKIDILPLPIAGIISDLECKEVAQRYQHIDSIAKELGSTLIAPLMTLSFMTLLVIPELKLSDRGLFSGANFEFVELFNT